MDRAENVRNSFTPWKSFIKLAGKYSIIFLWLADFGVWLNSVPFVMAHTDLTSILRRNIYYNRDDVPTADEGKATVVQIQMYIEGMSSFRAQTMDFHLDIYFQLKWVDERLAHNGSKRILVKDPKLFDLIWHPDLYFANARTAEFHHVTSPNFLVWIYQNGTVWYDCRVSLTVICMLNLARYPLDSQSCTLRILSYAYDVDQLVIEWNKGPQGSNESYSAIQTNPEILMPDMRLRTIMPGLRNDTYAVGVWSCATAEFIVDRMLMHHIIQSFLPSSLIVMISWFSFWLDVESVPGRVSLSITTLLTLATQNSAERMTLPQSSYVKASDVFGGVCMAFVFSTMIEFTVVNYCTRRKHPRDRHFDEPVDHGEDARASEIVSKRLLHEQMLAETDLLEKKGGAFRGICMDGENGDENRSDHPVIFRTVTSVSPSPGKKFISRKKKLEQRMQRVEQNRKEAQSIDRKCRIYFPLAFLIFNIIYWVYYLVIATDEM
ncbi:neurotransmitter-gated ion-channel ligand binding domain-containing protein [Ditylenchus destructor]|nr:neurotransmitter-gated ion-channel ligand binding domain-containing protein [Ditylenchus destructor]